MAAKAQSRTNAAEGGDDPVYQPFVKIWLGGEALRGTKRTPMRNTALGNFEIPGLVLSGYAPSASVESSPAKLASACGRGKTANVNSN
jgi:hypothetical protein